ncbi:MAG: hypothetical protein ACLFWL_05330, partial [Candidatus Brocadiia bacterium]
MVNAKHKMRTHKYDEPANPLHRPVGAWKLYAMPEIPGFAQTTGRTPGYGVNCRDRAPSRK